MAKYIIYPYHVQLCRSTYTNIETSSKHAMRRKKAQILEYLHIYYNTHSSKGMYGRLYSNLTTMVTSHGRRKTARCVCWGGEWGGCLRGLQFYLYFFQEHMVMNDFIN